MAQVKPKKNQNRYVEVTLDEFNQFMKSNLFAVVPYDKSQPQRELVYSFTWNDDKYMIKVYSSITPMKGKSRPSGGDAIRVVLFADTVDRMTPMWKAPRVYRTKNWRKNLQRHIDECLLRGKEGEEYKCPLCDEPVILRDGKNGKFWACSSWTRTKCDFTADFEG